VQAAAQRLKSLETHLRNIEETLVRRWEAKQIPTESLEEKLRLKEKEVAAPSFSLFL
jgi:hypothetical protein